MPSADIFVQFCGHLVEELSHRPVRHGVRDFGCEVEEDVNAVRRMHDFGIELNPVDFVSLVGGSGVLRCCDGRETLGRLRDMVAGAHPYGAHCRRKPVIYAEF